MKRRDEPQRAAAGGRLTVARLDAFRRLALENALAEVAHEFARRRLRFLVLKGPVFARWLYDDPCERPYGDLDLLVRRTQMANAGEALSELGFALAPPHNTTDVERSRYHELWIRPGELPVELELHYTLGLVGADPALVWRRFIDRAELVQVGRARVLATSVPVAAFQVALHAAFHEHSNWSSPHRRAQPPVRDLRQALDRVEFEIWRAADAVAAELGASAAFTTGLCLDPRGVRLADRLERERESLV